MPDDKGKLTDADTRAVKEWFKKRWTKDSRCFFCSENNWAIGEHTVAPINMSPRGGINIGGPQYPQVMLICNNCGNTLYFNAPLIGIVESRKKAEEGGSDGEK